MKQSLQQSMMLRVSHWLRGLFKVAGLVALWVLTPTAYGQTPDCNTILACNDGVQVSVDNNCQAVITADVVLEAMEYDNSFYTVELRDMNGVPLNTNIVDGSFIGDTLEVKVTLDGCDLSCWGHITIEDKLPPVFTNCNAAIVDCGAATDPGSPGIPTPSATDACGGVVTYSHADNVEDLSCDTDFSRRIVRRWIATDPSGNTDTCLQIIEIRQADLADVVFPPSYDDDDLPSFSCDNNLSFNDDGTPDPMDTGFPSGIDCNNIQYYYNDIVFDLCGASLKVVRQWVVIDWCTGQELSDFQTIKIIDDAPPICSAVDDIFVGVSTDEGLCTGTFDVPPPNVQFECSDWSYTVGYKLRDEDGDPFENPIFDNVVANPDGSFTITDLPMDTTWIVYRVTDDCGNQTECFTEVFVTDDEAPSAICEGFSVISLDQVGWADLFAESLDDHSYDNCEIDRFEVKREDTPCGFPDDLTFGEKVNFCCEDIPNNPIRVTLRVYDKSGNYNDCIVNVSVQDKSAPVITSCPADITLDCGQDPTDMGLTGGEDDLEAMDNCNLTITSRIVGSLGSCGTGIVRRVWTVTDQQGLTDVCTQRITVLDSDPFGADDITWPQNVYVQGCVNTGLTPEELQSKPEIVNTDCADIAMSYEDETFYNAPGTCVKIIRHWRVVDWCNSNSQNPDFFEYDQKIEVNNDVLPEFVSGCDNQTVDAEPGACDAEVSVAVQATDDCTSASNLTFSYTIDNDTDGTIDVTGTGRSWTRNLPTGSHRVTFTVVDECDNEETCSFSVTVRDNKAPQPVCLGEVTWGMGEDGTTEIWASDFNLKSEDACADEDELVYSFDEAGTQTALTLSCDDLVDGVGTVIELDVYVTDPDGNTAFCTVNLSLQDNQNYCQDLGTRTALGGYITDMYGEGVQNTEVELVNTTMSEDAMRMTKEEGGYMFEEVNYYDGYEVAPYKNDDTDNGLSTLDLVLLQRHILGLTPLESPLQRIAGDVNGSKSITGADVVELRSVILGKTTDFANNTSWRFVDATHDWEEFNFDFEFPEAIQIEELYHQEMDLDFYGIKIGDINGSASGAGLEGRSSSTVPLVVDDNSYAAGDVVRIDVKAADYASILGLQLAIDLGELTFQSVEGISQDKVASEGSTVLVSLDAATGMELAANQLLFTIVASASRSGFIADQVRLGKSSRLAAEAYDMDARVAPVELQVRDAGQLGEQVVLSQNSPNPWGDNTVISYTVPVEGDVLLTMFDIAGRQIYSKQQFATAGKHSIVVTSEQLGASGVIYYRLDAAGASITKKMILVD